MYAAQSIMHDGGYRATGTLSKLATIKAKIRTNFLVVPGASNFLLSARGCTVPVDV